MAGYIIHLAIGEEYIRKHRNDITNKEEFVRGIIKPDKLLNKLESHYGEKDSIDSLKRFLEVNKKERDKDYIKGYFLHLFTDYIFYSKYFKKKHYYEDYDKTNKKIMEKYNVKIPKELKKHANFIEGEPEKLKYHLLYEIIELVTEESINKIIDKILKGEYI